MKLFHKVIIAIVMFIMLTSSGNTQTIHSDIRNLSEGADLIVTGKVTNQKSNINPNNSRIYTQVTIKVDDYLKGETNQAEIILTNLGGEVGNVGESYSHVPTFTNGEDILVFVKRSEKDMSLRVFEGDAGKLTLYTDKKTGEKVTSQNVKVSNLKEEIKNFVAQQ